VIDHVGKKCTCCHTQDVLESRCMGIVELARPLIGFVCGAFDLLHPGHILMLEDAAAQCDYLVVGLHVDPSLERPEKNKPVQSAVERVMILRAIKHVDSVIVYNRESDLERILYELKPDVRVLGSDWKDKTITAPNAAKRIHWHERDHNWSSSELRRRVFRAEYETMDPISFDEYRKEKAGSK